jgi:hypothetical protein
MRMKLDLIDHTLVISCNSTTKELTIYLSDHQN